MAADLTLELTIEVAYLSPSQQWLKTLSVPSGTTAMQALQASGVLDAFAELAADTVVLGIYGVRVEPEQVLKAGDRVEVYRPLLVDPKEARRRRAARG